MTAMLPATPQRPLPGSFAVTPVPNKQPAAPALIQPSIFRRPSNQQLSSSQNKGTIDTDLSRADGPKDRATASPSLSRSLTPLERASRTINETLANEARYPELDGYVTQGISSDYDISSMPAWAPFQKLKSFEIPEKILDQYNRAQVSTMMGLFADIGHAWISIDNALYLWDYTHPNPELIGYEDQPNSITAVRLITPRPGVFVHSISRILVIATTLEIILMGLSSQPLAGGALDVSLYQTRMHTTVRGIDVTCIEGSKKWGRVFFGGTCSEDVYELTYQQEEKWFASRCSKINHTSKSISAILPTLNFGKTQQDHVTQITVDDTRNLLYILSSSSSIRIFHIRPGNNLDLVVTRKLSSVMSNIGHMVSRGSELLQGTRIISLSPIPSNETSRLNLMATTSTGCRIFFSATSGNYYSTDSSGAPTSMQVHHVKFPPRNAASATSGHPNSPAQLITSPSLSSTPIDISSKSLTFTRSSIRFPPGYFFCFVQQSPQSMEDLLFLAAPDTGRIARPPDGAQVTKFSELGQLVSLGGRAEDLGLRTPPFTADSKADAIAFGNELAEQYDRPAAEVVILTHNGIHTFRRRRLVDVFAAIMRYGGGDDGLEAEVKKFVRIYGRGESSATALAVACGQGLDSTTDIRVARVTDSEVIEQARKVFIEFGGKPVLNENLVLDRGTTSVENVRPSPRHEGLSLYISRLVRSTWRLPIIRETISPQGGLSILPTTPISKLVAIQRDLEQLLEFLDSNKTVIDGLAGAATSLSRLTTKQEELAMQGEHLALNSLVRLLSHIIEGLSFVPVLFDEGIDEIVLLLQDTSRQRLRQLTFEGLFCLPEGKEMAKELVKAIVNRNIIRGSNVDTVTDSLRRRCGSFCSPEDVVIFKAQEQLKKASEAGSTTESGRLLLNESLRLFTKVAGSLTMEDLELAVKRYISMDFYAGAVRLALKVAHEVDRENAALVWLKNGLSPQDPKQKAFSGRQACYGLIRYVIQSVDQAARPAADGSDDLVLERRKQEAYEEINGSDDEVFQTTLFDWYLSQGWIDRLLEIRSTHVINYLKQKSVDDVSHADLLWKYYARYKNFLDAAKVQLQLAKSGFPLTLSSRIEYLSRAKTNSSTRIAGLGEMGTSKQSKQELLREINDLIDVAAIQEDLLQRMKGDARLTAVRRPEILKMLDGQILSLNELYNGYADQADYYDLCIIIYQAADYRTPSDIRATWQNLLETTHAQTEQSGEAQPWEVVGGVVRRLGARLNYSNTTFSIPILLPMLIRYSISYQREISRSTWAVDLFLDMALPHEKLVTVLEELFSGQEPPFIGSNRRLIAESLVHVVRQWYEDTARAGGLVFGGEENVAVVDETLRMVLTSNILDEQWLEEGRILRLRLEQILR